MTAQARPRRAAILCTIFTRNLAFYRAGWSNDVILFPRSELWATINGNFLDIAVIEWCKLFADDKAYHIWRKVVSEPSSFLPQLIHDFGKTDIDWNSDMRLIRTYRDKFLAHLDQESRMMIPSMEFAEFAIFYLYDTLRAEQDASVFRNLPDNLRAYRQASHAAAENLYQNAA